MPEIIYEDNHLLIVVKPPNQLAQGDRTGDPCLLDDCRAYLKERYHKPGEVYLGLVHRMDRPVGGLLALARTSKAAARLTRQLQAGEMGREYIAVCQGRMPQAGRLVHFLLKDEDRNQVSAVPEDVPGAKKAILRYDALAWAEDQTLLHICLDTGRSHQIRAQLQAAGHPLRFDMRYGQGRRGEPVALWGAILSLIHPTLGKPMTFVSPPRGAAFDPPAYKAAIAALLAARSAPGGSQRGGDLA